MLYPELLAGHLTLNVQIFAMQMLESPAGKIDMTVHKLLDVLGLPGLDSLTHHHHDHPCHALSW